MSEKPRDPSPTAQPEPGARDEYSPPAIRWEEPFDVHANLASACGKANIIDLGCTLVQTS